MEHDQAPLSIEALPDALLGLVLVRVCVGDEPGPAQLCSRRHLADAASVCQRWRRVCFTEPRVWAAKLKVDFHEGSEELLHIRQDLLHRYETPVQHVQLSCPHFHFDGFDYDYHAWYFRRGTDGAVLAEWLHVLNPAALRQLWLAGSWHAAALQQLPALLPRFTHLGRLEVESNVHTELPAEALATLPQLPSLCSLSLSGQLAPGLGDSLLPLTQLTGIELVCEWARHDSWWQALQALPQLRRLALQQHSYLWNLGFELYATWEPEDEHLPQLCLPNFPALQECTLVTGGGFLLGRSRVRECSYADVPGVGGQLLVEWPYEYSPASAGSLEGLLAAAMPRRGPQLCSLKLQRWQVSAAAIGSCSQLAGLRELKLDHCHFEQLSVALAALLSQASGLTSLHLVDAGGADVGGALLEELPAALVQYSGLRCLKLAYLELGELPAGPYLRDLRELNLSFCSSDVLAPPALVAATALTRLELGGFVTRGMQPELTLADVEGVLLCLPALRQLAVRGDLEEGSAQAVAHLRSRAPQLEVATGWQPLTDLRCAAAHP